MATSRASTGQVTASAAEVYERLFVPALFAQWPSRVLDEAGVTDGDDVVDVGCGTGILAREAVRRLRGTGSVTGVDVNDAMLAVARRLTDAVAWRPAPAEALPFAAAAFDRVISQFAMMFFTDLPTAVREMARVVRPGGTVTGVTWAHLGEAPGYAALVELLADRLGDEAAAALAAPFRLGTRRQLAEVFEGVFDAVDVRRLDSVARFDSVAEWVRTEVRGWTLDDAVDDDQLDDLVRGAEVTLTRFVDREGRVRFPVVALVAVAGSPQPSPLS